MIFTPRPVLFLTLLLSLSASAPELRAQSPDKDLVAKGQYIFALAGGCACHTEPKGTLNAGGRAFPIPLGTVYSTNITSDKETGLGSWTDQQIRDALAGGIRRDGSRLIPVMPYEAYSGMAEEDMRALIAYLRTLKPVRKVTPEFKSRAPLARSVGVALYLKAFGQFATPPPQAPKSGVERGRYLVEHVSLCGDCHTPRNSFGVPNRSLYLAGFNEKDSLFNQGTPNITPDRDTGIGDWQRDDIVELLKSGTKADGDVVEGLMYEVVQGTVYGYKDMTREDALAIADYLKTVQPIKNKVR